ncbi:MAG TPA: NAD(P)H-binding protein [bacterium]|nr:NAD(P)H-binding protein [bacterium]
METETLDVVTGAFGFTGGAITRRLLSKGRRVKTLTRRPDRPNPFGERVRVAAYRFDDPDELARSLEGAAVLYNTYWVRFPYGRATFAEAIANTRTLLRACEAARIRRIVHLSVTSASEDSPLPYFRGKGILERAIRESALSYAILRPGLIYGPGDILLNNIAWFLRHFPAFVIPDDGGYRLQCADVEDVAEVAVSAAERAENFVVDVVGPETFTFDELVRLIAGAIRSRARIVHLPPGLVRILLGMAGRLVHDVILTPDEITGLMSDLLVSRGAPVGRRRLRDWLDEHGPRLGRTYASELGRHYP